MEAYKTKDIFEASWLYSQDLPFRLETDNGKYFWFVFENYPRSKKLSDEYWSQKANGNIKAFVNSLKTLKDLVFSQR